MLTLLRSIIEAILYIPDYILWAVEEAFNGFSAAITAVWEAATALIPLPAEPSPPEYIAQINWFFPIGAVVTIMGPILIGYISFLAIRWIYKKVGDL